jgi:energy-coupling factor transporter ATP-binding protein EcfA2
MPLLSVTVHGYRGFAKPARLELAVPNGRPGSGLTLLVGPNNGGKSTVLETLQFLQRPDEPPPMTEGRRNAAAGGEVSIEYESDKGAAALGTSGRGGDVLWRKQDLGMKQGSVFAVPSRRALDVTFAKFDQDRRTYASTQPHVPMRQLRSHFAPRLFGIQRNRKLFDDTLCRIVGNVPQWYIEQTDGGHNYLKFCSASSPHSSEGLGDGLITLFYLVDALYDSSPGDVIVVDEPELSLHPAYQRRLAHVIAEFAADRQIICATHSTYFADWNFVANGASISRVYLLENRSTISALGTNTGRQTVRLLRDRNNPHLLGTTAREVFFLEDGVILVEGQEDILSYPMVAAQLSLEMPGTFYGWGVGGATNMPIIAQVLTDLGFRKVVGILDQGRADVLRTLKAKFPQYPMAVIPAADIRSKPRVPPRRAVSGILDSKGKLRQKYRNEMQELLWEIGHYFETGSIRLAPPGRLIGRYVAEKKGWVSPDGVVIDEIEK